ncbi:MAG: ABC transporter permease subunit [Planctomycetota bacterium]|jgi:ABC-type transport system involved in multi-copper enzyme maturation permease subunit
MRAYELMKETLLRKTYIRIVHISWFAIYGLIFIIPFPAETWHWGPFIFAWSGCLLPLLLSAGIFGNDIASGRISILITKPLRLGELYIYRLMGMSLQAFLHLVISGCVIFILHGTTGRGDIDNLGLWILSSWLIFNTWAALSTSLSVVVRRGNNSMLLFVATGFTFFFASFLVSFIPDHTTTIVLKVVLRYTCPPIELLVNLANGKYSVIQNFACVMHSLVLTALYSIVGIIILIKRQFACESD